TDGSGHLVCVSFTTSGVGTAKLDFPVGTSPGNPSAGSVRIYGDSGSGLFTCLTSAGASCLTSSTTQQIVFNDGGILAGIANTTWNKTTHTLTFDPAATISLPSATSGTTQSTGDSTTKIATDQFVSQSAPLVYNSTGTRKSSPHTVVDTETLAGGTLTVTLTGSSVFTSSSSFSCSANDSTAAAVIEITYASGSSLTFTGTGTDTFRYICIGN